MGIHTIDIISVIFFMHPYIFELTCGSDMDMMLNHFGVFLYPNTPNFTSHKFLDLTFYLSLKKTKLLSIFQTFVLWYISLWYIELCFKI